MFGYLRVNLNYSININKTVFMRIIIIIALLIITLKAESQTIYETSKVVPSSEEQMKESITRKRLMQEESDFKNIEFRSIGPTVMSGRVVDIEANPDDPSIFYAAYASGGIFKTSNNGITFEPIFDNEESIIIGDIAVDWKNNIIYAGTGENNSSRSSYSGTGIYKSTNGGKDWIHLGLQGGQRTGRIIIDPKNPNIIYAAVLGSLYSANSERGVYKSVDGGMSFTKVLYINNITGAIDIEINPENTQTLYAAMWERERRAWDFRASGKNSGIYKTNDGGETWNKLGNGLPEGEGFGRCGLALSVKNPEIIYALIDNNAARPDTVKKEEDKVTKDVLKKISKEGFLKLNRADVENFLKKYDFPKEYDYDYIAEKIEDDELKPSALAEYVEDSNSNLFETEVKGAEVYRSDDGGTTWKKTHEEYLDKVFYTFGYYFANIRVSPFGSDKIYILGVPLIKSEDGGKSFVSINGDNVHVDHHGLWINPKKEGHIINGNDGGINISYDDGLNWYKANAPAVGQFYSVNYDLAVPYNVYGGLQDNGVWYGASNNKITKDWHNTGDYPFKNLMGGDGMQVAIDTRNNDVVYTGYQFGNYYRITKSKNEFKYITPEHKLGERPYRFNWQTPIQISPFNQDVIYLGSNRLHKSVNRGENFETISGDLTNGGRKGNVPYGTLTTISLSHLKEGLIYTGSDDGLVYMSKDDGEKWVNISNGLPQNMWVTRIIASKHKAGTVYATLNGYRWDDFGSYVYRSDDYGRNWKRTGSNLPSEPVNVIKEDTEDGDILYLGTDAGLYVSTDKGMTFFPFKGNLPNVSVHDIAVHPVESEIIIGTHGRSIYIADIRPVREFKQLKRKDRISIFRINNVFHNSSWGERMYDWNFNNPDNLLIPFYNDKAQDLSFRITTDSLKTFYEGTSRFDKGTNYIKYDFTIQDKFIDLMTEKERKEMRRKENGKYYLKAGKYIVELSDGNYVSRQTFEIRKRE